MRRRKRIGNKILKPLLLLVIGSCISCGKEWLEEKPKGQLDEFVLADAKGIDGLLIGAYSLLDGVSDQFGWEAASSNWVYGSIRGMEANKGTDAGDSGEIPQLATFSESPLNPYLNVKWREVYAAVARCNSAIVVTNLALKEGKINQEQADLFLRQARVLRGWYHFEAWRMWAMIPYVDENTDQNKLTNTEDTRDKIIADLEQGTGLPDNMGAIGRFNATVSKVLLAKALMQMKLDYVKALSLLLEVKIKGTKPDGKPIGLAHTYGEVFDIENRNGIEAVYTVQYSVNDGSGAYNAGWGEVLNFPYKGGGSPGGCCGFYQPAQEFVNSFLTDASGLPMLDNSYNLPANADFRDQGVPAVAMWDSAKIYHRYIDSTWWNPRVVKDYCTYRHPSKPYQDLCYETLVDNNKGNNPTNSQGAWKLIWTEDNSKSTDPRLDWTVGRRGIPYWDWGIHTGSDWIRDQTYAGPYSPKKQVYKKSQEGIYTETGNWTSGWTANGYRMIRFADVLLLLAECQIETGDLAGALTNINAVRARAANPDGFVKEADGITPAANYKIGIYISFPDADYARKALRMERKLELGMEGHRWFDLNRWGITVAELNRILAYEKTTPWGRNMYGTATVGLEDVSYPIPQRQIDLSNGRLVQNR